MRKIILSLVLLLAALACALPGVNTTSPVQVVNPVDAVALETIIAQTVAGAQTQTVAAQPPTLTPTQTREPTPTFIAQPATHTPFILFTANVPLETLDPAYAATAGVPGSVGDPGEEIPYTGRPWTCAVKSVSPPRGALVEAGKEFYVTWSVLNTGTKNWTVNTIDFIYKGGYRHEGKPIQDLSKNVPSGGKVNLQVLFKAPKVAGEYATTWTLRVGNFSFCGMRAFFEVKK